MEYVITDFGSRIIITPEKDPFMHGVIEEIATGLQNRKNIQSESFSMMIDMLEALYYSADIGYYYYPGINLAPSFNFGKEGVIRLYIPSPALVEVVGERKAVEMLEIMIHGKPDVPVGTLDDEEFKDVYENIPRECEAEEETEDNEEEDAEGEEEMHSHSHMYDGYVTQNSSFDQYIHKDKIRQLYRLKKGSDLYKYKKVAKAYYRLEDNYFMETKPCTVLKDDSIRLQNVDTTYAVKIPLNKI